MCTVLNFNLERGLKYNINSMVQETKLTLALCLLFPLALILCISQNVNCFFPECSFGTENAFLLRELILSGCFAFYAKICQMYCTETSKKDVAGRVKVIHRTFSTAVYTKRRVLRNFWYVYQTTELWPENDSVLTSSRED